MNSKEVASFLKLLAQLMELNDENKFKISSYQNASFQLSKLNTDISNLSAVEIAQIKGVGNSISLQIVEFIEKGTTEYLNSLVKNIPKGVLAILQIKGLGPSKVKSLWKEHQIENIGELLQACEENRLIQWKGFGEKTQEEIKKNIQYIQSSVGKYHYAALETLANEVLIKLKEKFGDLVALTSDFRRKNEIISQIDYVVGTTNPEDIVLDSPIPIQLHFCLPSEFIKKLFATTCTEEHLQIVGHLKEEYSSEEEIYTSKNLHYVIPEMREGMFEKKGITDGFGEIISHEHILGSIHNHTNWSDGRNTLEEMVEACKNLGYSYFGISDHSKSAFYANGLDEKRILQQWNEINSFNLKSVDFKVFKGIESDILMDGSLDYSAEILKEFDFVVASVHANLKMEESKANERLIKAIENPYTTMLGHPTGRLLLSRNGYPINHKKIIDACAQNKVAIELNANPLRLDIDWRWLPYAMEKNVMISINPDAHNTFGLQHVKYGVNVARKAGLLKKYVVNALPLADFEVFLKSKK
jgi:DNA polymerase (family X)